MANRDKKNAAKFPKKLYDGDKKPKSKKLNKHIRKSPYRFKDEEE